MLHFSHILRWLVSIEKGGGVEIYEVCYRPPRKTSFSHVPCQIIIKVDEYFRSFRFLFVYVSVRQPLVQSIIEKIYLEVYVWL